MSQRPLHERIAALRTPVALAMVVVTAAHHLLSNEILKDWHVTSEILVYGGVIPLAAWVLLGWLARSARTAETARQLEAEANADLARRTQQIEALYNAGRLLAGTRGLEDITESLLDLARGITDAEAGVLLLYPEVGATPLAAVSGPAGSSLREAALRHVQTDPCLTCPATPRCPMPADVRCQPIIAGSEVLGVLRLKNPAWDAATRQSLNTLLAEMAATWMARRAESRALAAFTRAGHGFRSRENLADILERFVDLVCQALGATGGALYRLRDGVEPMRVAGSPAVPAPDAAEWSRADPVWTGAGGRRIFALSERGSLIALDFPALRPLSHRDVGLLRIIASESAFLLDVADTFSDIVWRERQRLAGELHDGLAQTLAHLNLQTNRLRGALRTEGRARAPELLEEISGVILDAYEEVRQTIDDLRLCPHEGEGAASFLRRVVAPIAARSRVLVDLRLAESMTLPREVLAQIARIVQEATANAIRHGQAGRIEVRLAERDGELALSIRDDGAGFDPAAAPPSGHHGLAVMRERVEALDGRFALETGPGQGVHLHAAIPLRAARASARPAVAS